MALSEWQKRRGVKEAPKPKPKPKPKAEKKG